jgi:ubiquinone/menaquinone biosynthesis C-methylase UbiE
MKTHFDHLVVYIDKLSNKYILDLGSGAGDFLIDCAQHGYKAIGLELNPDKIQKSLKRSKEAGVVVDVRQGEAEHVPFADNEFGFVNVSEVIEHVQNPKQVLNEIYRVMQSGGTAYMSVHNRFGLYDTHFHLYCLGWMPRVWGEKYIRMFKKHKDYGEMPDLQRISDMHYYTFGGFKKISQKMGFKIIDIREEKIRKKMGILASLIYRYLLRPWYFSTFHILLKK